MNNKKPNNNNENESNNNNDFFSQFFSQFFGSENNNFPSGFSFPNINSIKPEDVQKMGSNLPMDPYALQQMFQQFSNMFTMIPGYNKTTSPNSNKENYLNLIKDAAFKKIIPTDESSNIELEKLQAIEYFKVANELIKNSTSLSLPQNNDVHVWKAKEWIDGSIPIWQKISKPISDNMSKALIKSIEEQLPEEVKNILNNASYLIDGLGGSIFGLQIGKTIGELSNSVLSANDLSIPLTGNKSVLIFSNIRKYFKDFKIPIDDIMIFLAVRESAYVRLFNKCPWIKEVLITSIENYAKYITFDNSNIEKLVQEFDISNPEKINKTISSRIFLNQKSKEQIIFLNKIKTIIILIEGWVDRITQNSTKDIPNSGKIQEIISRRHATNGPSEKAVKALVNIEIESYRIRKASKLWQIIENLRSIEKRDALWMHPDLLPNAEDIDNPETFEQRDKYRKSGMHDIDDALKKLFSGGFESETKSSES